MSNVPFKTLNLEPVKCSPTEDEISVIITLPSILASASIDIDKAEPVVTDIILLVEKFRVVVNDDDKVIEVEPILLKPLAVIGPSTFNDALSPPGTLDVIFIEPVRSYMVPLTLLITKGVLCFTCISAVNSRLSSASTIRALYRNIVNIHFIFTRMRASRGCTS